MLLDTPYKFMVNVVLSYPVIPYKCMVNVVWPLPDTPYKFI